MAKWLSKKIPQRTRSLLFQSFFEKVETLQEFSKLGCKVPEFNDTSIREIFVYSYRLIYKLNKEKITQLPNKLYTYSYLEH